MGFPGGSDGEESANNARDVGSVPGEGNGNVLQYSCLENPLDRGARQATVHGVTKSWTQLTIHIHALLTLQPFGESGRLTDTGIIN